MIKIHVTIHSPPGKKSGGRSPLVPPLGGVNGYKSTVCHGSPSYCERIAQIRPVLISLSGMNDYVPYVTDEGNVRFKQVYKNLSFMMAIGLWQLGNV